ncbi:hypothetical protein [Bacillus sp. 1P06AnD]|uniref:hypothetical protein n=1 Tax=Bacillus sp. 1P06AnD TaxID=3132208 RepID=UPI00399FF412
MSSKFIANTILIIAAFILVFFENIGGFIVSFVLLLLSFIIHFKQGKTAFKLLSCIAVFGVYIIFVGVYYHLL